MAELALAGAGARPVRRFKSSISAKPSAMAASASRRRTSSQGQRKASGEGRVAGCPLGAGFQAASPTTVKGISASPSVSTTGGAPARIARWPACICS
jgi:hypothetical protein